MDSFFLSYKMCQTVCNVASLAISQKSLTMIVEVVTLRYQYHTTVSQRSGTTSTNIVDVLWLLSYVLFIEVAYIYKSHFIDCYFIIWNGSTLKSLYLDDLSSSWQSTICAMKRVGFTDEQIHQICSVSVPILVIYKHLNNSE